jgi:hypothetical protein
MPRSHGAVFFVAVEAKMSVSLASPERAVDQRKSPSWHAWAGLRVRDFQFDQRAAAARRIGTAVVASARWI